jgi:tetratricopeptide (TPR) repeat protein
MPRVGPNRRLILIAIGTLIVGAAAAFCARAMRVPRSTSLLPKAALAYDRRDWPAAEHWSREQLKQVRDDSGALRLLARALYRQERDEPATLVSERVPQDMLEAEDYLVRGQAFVRVNRPDLAMAAWRESLRFDPHAGEPRMVLANVLLQQDRLTEAEVEASALSREAGWEARGDLLLGRVFGQQADPAAAAAALERALSRSQEWHGADEPGAVRRRLARSYLETGRPRRARKVLEQLRPSALDAGAFWLLSRCDIQERLASSKNVIEQALAYRQAHPTEPEPSPYLGEMRCAPCHSGIFREQHASRHARTYVHREQYPSLPFPDRPIADPGNSQVTHDFQKTPDALEVHTKLGGQVFRAVVDYVFGSGDRGLTPVIHDAQGRYFEARMSYYHEPVGWDVTSGHPVTSDLPAAVYQGLSLSLDDVRRCMDCHNTNPHGILTQTGPESRDNAIGCERCHGPGGNHLLAVAARSADLAIGRPSLASGAPIVELCAACHSPRSKDQKLSPGSPAAARFPGATLPWSRCYSESRGALDCTTCHDPHKNAEKSMNAYEARCLECHAATRPVPGRLSRSPGNASERGQSSCPVQPASGCITCHMPRVKTPVAHTSFTDHFIRVHRESRPDVENRPSAGSQP